MTVFSPTPVDDPVAAELLDEYFTSRELGFTSHPGGYRIVHPDPGDVHPAGRRLRGGDAPTTVRSSAAAACVCSSPERGEIKHLWMRPTARGTGAGRALLADLERRAADFGATEVVLDTNESLEAAQHIYRTSGYSEVAALQRQPQRDALVPQATALALDHVAIGREWVGDDFGLRVAGPSVAVGGVPLEAPPGAIEPSRALKWVTQHLTRSWSKIAIRCSGDRRWAACNRRDAGV